VNGSCCPRHHGQTNATQTITINESSSRIWRRNSAYHVCLVGYVKAYGGFAIGSAATVVGSCGRHARTGVVSAHGVARGRANVSRPSTSGGNTLEPKHQDDVIEELWLGRTVFTTSGSPVGTGSLPRGFEKSSGPESTRSTEGARKLPWPPRPVDCCRNDDTQ
jgi:hypothetical protein